MTSPPMLPQTCRPTVLLPRKRIDCLHRQVWFIASSSVGRKLRNRRVCLLGKMFTPPGAQE